MPNQNALIRLNKISKIFSTDMMETKALNNLSLEIRQGDYLSISGPSGCGKSTLLSILGLLDLPTSGEYEINGVDVSDFDASQRALVRNKEIGFIFQDFNLIGDLTVFENVELPLTYQKLDKGERARKVQECLEKVGMKERAEHYPGQLSGGQQQRVAVARALVGSPSVILADEPTGNLDSKNGDSVMNLLGELNQEGVTICIVTHDSRYADYAKRTVNLFDGQLVDDTNVEIASDVCVEKQSGETAEYV